jgi:hypothetical protein
VSTTEEQLERKSSGSGLENRDYGRKGSAALTTAPLYPKTLALTSPTIGGRLVGIVRWRTKAAECFFFLYSGHYPSFCLLFTAQLDSTDLSAAYRKYISSPLRAQHVNNTYRFMTMVYWYNYYNSGYYPSSRSLFKEPFRRLVYVSVFRWKVLSLVLTYLSRALALAFGPNWVGSTWRRTHKLVTARLTTFVETVKLHAVWQCFVKFLKLLLICYISLITRTLILQNPKA